MPLPPRASLVREPTGVRNARLPRYGAGCIGYDCHVRSTPAPGVTPVDACCAANGGSTALNIVGQKMGFLAADSESTLPLGGHRPGSGGAGWVSGHAGGCTLQGLTVWVFRHRGFPGRGQGGPETGVDMTKVGPGITVEYY